MILKENLEKAIIECNIVIKRWQADKPKLVTYENLRGLLIQNLKKSISHSFTWREARGFFSLRMLFVNVDLEKGYITDIVLREEGRPRIQDHKAELVVEIMRGLDFEVLGKKSLERMPVRQVEIDNVSFDYLKSINF